MLIELTDEAISKLLEKTTENKNIKIGIKGSGCNGYSYDFDYLKSSPDLESSFELDYGKFSVWIDYTAVEYLDGMTLDFQY